MQVDLQHKMALELQVGHNHSVHRVPRRWQNNTEHVSRISQKAKTIPGDNDRIRHII